MVLEKILESRLDCKEIRPANPKGNQSWIFIESTNAEVDSLVVWPPDAKNWLIGKDPDAGKDWKQEEEGTTEDEMIGWHQCPLTWVWTSPESWWWTEEPSMLQSMGPHRVGHEWVTELNWCTSYYRRRYHFTFSFSFMLPNLNKHTVSPYLHQWHFLFIFQPQLSHLFQS